MNVIAYRTVRAFANQYPEAEPFLRLWYNTLCKLEPRNFAELKNQFPSVDSVPLKDGTIVFIFDVAGNNYRVVTRIDFEYQVGFILYVFYPCRIHQME